MLQVALRMRTAAALWLKAPGAVARPAAKVLTLPKMNNKIPFIPIDWYFRFFPNITKDKVRTLYRHNVISYLGAMYVFYFMAHTPFKGDGYLHSWESPLYHKVKRDMEASGQLEENMRIKVSTFYPAPAEE